MFRADGSHRDDWRPPKSIVKRTKGKPRYSDYEDSMQEKEPLLRAQSRASQWACSFCGLTSVVLFRGETPFLSCVEHPSGVLEQRVRVVERHPETDEALHLHFESPKQTELRERSAANLSTWNDESLEKLTRKLFD